MKIAESIVRKVLMIAVIILIPFILIMSSVRLLMNPFYLQIEYRMPGFPPDSYGFTLQDRLKWSAISLDYLLNDQGISFLADKTFADGTPIYNERELSHLVDVKNVVQSLLRDWLIAIILFLVISLLGWRLKWWSDIRKGISIGGWATIGVIVLILVFVVTSFATFFTDFHELFFTANSWVFLYSDTLIRLFPMRFWQDGFIYIGTMCIIAGFLLGWFLRTKPSR